MYLEGNLDVIYFLISQRRELRPRRVKKRCPTLAFVAQLVGVLSCKLKRHGFDSQSGHMVRSWVWFPDGVHMRGAQSMFLPHSNVPFPFSLSLSFPLSEINKHVFR